MITLRSSIQFKKQKTTCNMIKLSSDNGVECANYNGSLNVKELKKKKNLHVGYLKIMAY